MPNGKQHNAKRSGCPATGTTANCSSRWQQQLTTAHDSGRAPRITATQFAPYTLKYNKQAPTGAQAVGNHSQASPQFESTAATPRCTPLLTASHDELRDEVHVVATVVTQASVERSGRLLVLHELAVQVLQRGVDRDRQLDAGALHGVCAAAGTAGATLALEFKS